MDVVLTTDEKKNGVFKGNSSDYVKLNVGGWLYHTTVATLTKQEDTMLAAMFSGRMEVHTDPEGWVLIHRCGKLFGIILNFLRGGNVPLPNSQQDIAELLKEANYYCIKELEVLCSGKTDFKNVNPLQIVPKSQEELDSLIKNTSKPIILLYVNLKYVTQNHFEVLKNIALFDKFSVNYQDLLVFIKVVFDISSMQLKWSFCGEGKQIDELPFDTNNFKESDIYEKSMKLLAYVKK